MHITNEILLADIANTEKEVEAYRMISEGFATLARLPESTGATDRINAAKYNRLCDECRTFLGKLNKIKTERGL